MHNRVNSFMNSSISHFYTSEKYKNNNNNNNNNKSIIFCGWTQTAQGFAQSAGTVHSVEMQIHANSKGKVALDDITLWANFCMKCHKNIISGFHLIAHYASGGEPER